jgi:hypothetical protein
VTDIITYLSSVAVGAVLQVQEETIERCVDVLFLATCLSSIKAKTFSHLLNLIGDCVLRIAASSRFAFLYVYRSAYPVLAMSNWDTRVPETHKDRKACHKGVLKIVLLLLERGVRPQAFVESSRTPHRQVQIYVVTAQ